MDLSLKQKVLALRNNSSIMDKLQSSRLQATIERIDLAEDRLDELERELDSNKHFNDFMVELMKGMSFYDEEGNFDGKGC